MQGQGPRQYNIAAPKILRIRTQAYCQCKASWQLGKRLTIGSGLIVISYSRGNAARSWRAWKERSIWSPYWGLFGSSCSLLRLVLILMQRVELSTIVSHFYPNGLCGSPIWHSWWPCLLPIRLKVNQLRFPKLIKITHYSPGSGTPFCSNKHSQFPSLHS